MAALKSRSSTKTLTIVQLAVFCAIIILLGLTPLGFIQIGPLSLTLVVIPVAVGAIVLGPLGGAVLGGMFGLVSFIRCFGLEALGVFFLSINPIYTFILCMVPRIAVGLLTGLTYKFMSSRLKNGSQTISVVTASLVCPVLNTILFIGFLILLFGGNSSVLDIFGVTSAWAIYAVVLFNAAVEAGVTLVVSAAVARLLIHLIQKSN